MSDERYTVTIGPLTGEASRDCENALRQFAEQDTTIHVTPAASPAGIDVERLAWAYDAAINVVEEVDPDCPALGTLRKMRARLAAEEQGS